MLYQIWAIGLNEDHTMPSNPLDVKIAEAETEEDAQKLFNEISSTFINVSEPYIEMLLEKVKETENGEECDELIDSCVIPNITKLGVIVCNQ